MDCLPFCKPVRTTVMYGIAQSIQSLGRFRQSKPVVMKPALKQVQNQSYMLIHLFRPSMKKNPSYDSAKTTNFWIMLGYEYGTGDDET